MLTLLAAALAIGAAHADDHRLHASDGCAVCRHVRATPVVLGEGVAIAPLWFRWDAPVPAAYAPRKALTRHARARSPPVV